MPRKIDNKSDQKTVSAKVYTELAEEFELLLNYNCHSKSQFFRDAIDQYIQHYKNKEDYQKFLKKMKFRTKK